MVAYFVSYIPKRGDVLWLQFDPQAGHEQAGRRPAFVISPESYNGKVGLALVCSITSQVRVYPFEVSLPEDLEVNGVILVDQIKSLDWKARQAKFIGAVPVDIMQAVLAKLEVLMLENR
jgi:mRNA interferase MazF